MELLATGLVKRIEGRTLFDGLSLSVAAGEVVAVRGPSGCGKSVLLRLLAWLAPLDGGQITLDGRLPVEWGVPRWRAEVALVPQTPPPLAGTPADFAEAIQGLAVQRQRRERHRDPAAIARGWGIDAATWQRDWPVLSGGEAQRCHLAIALALNPAVLLLDEATSALDADSTDLVEQSLSDATAVWVTHDDAQAQRVASRTLVMG